jgi:integrase
MPHAGASEVDPNDPDALQMDSRERLALEMLYHIGVGRAELVRLGPQNIRKGVIAYVRQKTRNVKSEEIYLPMPKELAAIIAKTSTKAGETFLRTSRGKAFDAATFGNWFRKACDAAGLKGRSSHGVRKHVATDLAERGATDRQLMATFGWTTPKQATTYVRNADRKRLARDAMALREGAR